MSRAVAIITRTHNRPELLDRAMRSVLGQTFTDWIHVIVNDGGQPGPVDLLHQHWAAQYQGRCHILHLSPGRGMQDASNEALRSCPDTEFACIHDDDDSWHPRYLEETVGYLRARGPEHREQGVVTQTQQIIEEFTHDGNVIELSRHDYCTMDEVSLSRIAQGNLFPPIAFLYRRAMHERIGYFNQLFDPLGDFDFNLRFLATADIGLINRRLAYYHWRTRDKNQSVTGGVGTHRQMLARMKDYYLRRRDTSMGAILAPIVVTIPRPPIEQAHTVPFDPKPASPRPATNSKASTTPSLSKADCLLPQQAFSLPFHNPTHLWRHWEDLLISHHNYPNFPYAQARGLAALHAHNEGSLSWANLAAHFQKLTTLDTSSVDQAFALERRLWQELLQPIPQTHTPSAYCDTIGIPDDFWQELIRTHQLPSATLSRRLIRPDLGLSTQSKFVEFTADPQRPLFQQNRRPYTSGRLDLYSSVNLALACQPGQNQPKVTDSIEKHVYYKIGKEIAGPLIHDYLHWILERARVLNKPHIFFLSRDGYYLHRLFDQLKQQHNLPQQGTYLWGSRRMLNLAQYEQLDHEALAFLTSANPNLRVCDFLNRLGLSASDYRPQIAQAGFPSDTELLTTELGGAFLLPDHKSKLENLFKLIEEDILEMAARERSQIREYLTSVGFNTDTALLVDVGWQASSAIALQRIHDRFKPLHALYFATWSEASAAEREGCVIDSYFLHQGKNPFRRFLLAESPNLLEILFQAPHPSVLSVQKTGDGWSPHYSHNLVSGITPEYRPAFEQGMEDYWNARTKLPIASRNEFGQPYLEIALERLLREPTTEEASILGQLMHSEGFGSELCRPLVADIPLPDAPDESWERAYRQSNWHKAFVTLISDPHRRQLYTDRERQHNTPPPEFLNYETSSLYTALTSSMDFRTWLINQLRHDTHLVRQDSHHLHHDIRVIHRDIQKMLFNPRKLFYYLLHPKKKP